MNDVLVILDRLVVVLDGIVREDFFEKVIFKLKYEWL